ncbi:MAG: 50S ribosomal protein L4 [Verrucomicrobia bacterium]|nr:50S ribosomal protein L4 [Verrucomicrobiota bacterium]
MAVLKKYNLSGEEIGQIALDDEWLKSSANTQMIKDYLVAIQANARQWSANTQTRAEVNHSGKKPHPQKGTGNARQGYLGAPQYKGGGRVHAPRPKDIHTRINKKERRAAIRHLLVEKILAGRLHVLQFDGLKEPKTKLLSGFLEKRGIENHRVLFLAEGMEIGAKEGQAVAPKENYENFIKSIRNLTQSEFMRLPAASGYDVVVSGDLVILEPAVDQLKVILGGQR